MAATAPPVAVRDGVSPSCVALPCGPWPSVLDFLAERLPALSRATWCARMAQGLVVDERGQSLAPDAPFRPQSKLYYWRSLGAEQPIPGTVTVLFQDELLVLADKPHFLPVVPSGRYVQETLLVRLRRQLGIDTLTPMHRIDMDTAGLVMFCVQPRWRNAYQALFRERRVAKTYEAVAPWRAEVDVPPWRRSRMQESAHFMVMAEVPGPVNAETQIELIQHDGAWGHYRLRPTTGQRHQLRVHMNALGLPIMNDRIYPTLVPDLPPDAPRDFSAPLQLLAKELAFVDPVSGQPREFVSKRSLQGCSRALSHAFSQPNGLGGLPLGVEAPGPAGPQHDNRGAQ